MIVYGSQALLIGLNKIGRVLERVPTDLDVLVGSVEEANRLVDSAGLDVKVMSGGPTSHWRATAPDGKFVEIEIARPGSSSHLYLMWAELMAKLNTAEFYGVKMEVAPLAMLYSLKKAHRHSPRAFEKHVKDYNLLRELFDGKDFFTKVTDLRYKETVEREKLRTPSLNKSTKDFFDDNVSNRTFIHDQIHEVMAFGDRPAFEYIKVDPDKVACSKEKFMALHHTRRMECIQEEAYVIALERAMIPMLFEGGPLANSCTAYRWACMRICTTLCSGWFREYAVEHWDDLMLRFTGTYVEKFLTAVEDGKIKRIERENVSA